MTNSDNSEFSISSISLSSSISDEIVFEDNNEDENYQYYQVVNDIFNDPSPERDNRFRCYEYSIYLFYKSINNSNVTIEINNNLEYNWCSSGRWKLLDYNVIQINGPGPLHKLYQNEINVRREVDRLQREGFIQEYKIRFRYPELP